MREYPETHTSGHISIENMPPELGVPLNQPVFMEGDLGIQIAPDGRVWICINGAAFLRFSPHKDGKMSKEVK